jgi:hypothetical protein
MLNPTKLFKKSFKILKKYSTEKPHILHKSRLGKIKYLSDPEVLKDSEYPSEYFKSHVTIAKSEIQTHKGRLKKYIIIDVLWDGYIKNTKNFVNFFVSHFR